MSDKTEGKRIMKERTPEREAAYVAIDTERAYHQSRWATGDLGATVADADTRSIDEWSLYLQRYTMELVLKAANNPSERTEKLATMRKIAAMCVACMEQHGAPQR